MKAENWAVGWQDLDFLFLRALERTLGSNSCKAYRDARGALSGYNNDQGPWAQAERRV